MSDYPHDSQKGKGNEIQVTKYIQFKMTAFIHMFLKLMKINNLKYRMTEITMICLQIKFPNTVKYK